MCGLFPCPPLKPVQRLHPLHGLYIMADDYAAEITYLEGVVNGAVSATNTDGSSTTFDLAHAQKRLQELRLLQSSTLVRPTAFRVTLGGSW